jgi:hypothetical protein
MRHFITRPAMSVRFAIRRFLMFVCAFLCTLPARAEELGVQAQLSSKTTTVGEPVELEITVIGGRLDKLPQVLEIEGFKPAEPVAGGTAFRFNFNGVSSSRWTYSYALTPTRAGTLTIPEITFQIGGQALKTKPLALTVVAEDKPPGAREAIYGEIRLDKKEAYVGETVPAELRLYVAANYRVNLQKFPSALTGDGIAAKDFSKRPRQRELVQDNVPYGEFTLRTTVTATKAGQHKVSIAPVGLSVSKVSASRLGAARDVEIIIPEVTLNAKSLPTKGRPVDFPGLIGKFTMEVLGSPNRVNLGEPVQMVVKISGEGNFERVVTPPLDEPNAWRAYDAEENFAEGDELGLSGTKTFKLPVAPTMARTTMPVFAFSFFDPEAGAYQTLRNSPAPLTVIGAPPPAPAPAAVDTPPTPAAPPPPVAAPQAPQDILGILPDLGAERRWTVILSPKVFYSMLAAPLPCLLLLAWWQRRRGDPAAARLAELRREKAALLSRLRHSNERAEVLDAAARILQLDAAMLTGQPAAGIDLAAVLGARSVPAASVATIEALFSARADLLYAGGGRVETLSPAERDRVLQAIANYEGSAAQ